MSAVVLAEIVPVLLLAPLAGSLVDRLPRVRVMVLADLVRVVLAGVLALWHDSAAVAYAVAFGLSCGQVFFSPAAQSLLPSVVRDDELVAANSGIWTAAVTVVLAQDRLGGGEGFGVLVAAIGAGAALGPLLLLRQIKDPRRPLFISGRTPCAVSSTWRSRPSPRSRSPPRSSSSLSTSNRSRHPQAAS